MFQTHFHVFLQSFENEFLTGFMRLLTAVGYIEFFMVFLTVILFIVDFKKGFILLLILFWTAGITLFLKEHFNLPRPFHVDSRVQFLDAKLDNGASFEFSEMGAKAFWDILPIEVLEKIRQAKEFAHGFPSGHTSIALALWGGLILLFRKQWVTILSVSLILLIPFSRMYLGVHFIADILGGYAVGGLILFLFWLIILKKNRLPPYLEKATLPMGLNLRTIFLLLSPLLFYFILPTKLMQLPGSMFGYGLSFCLLAQKGFPEKGGSWGQKTGRMLLAISLYLAINFGFNQTIILLSWEEIKIANFIRYAVEGFIFLWVAVELNVRFGWFERMKTRTSI
ncbi:MAG: membrane-associated phospholipid phosphatase [Paraglaciecola sp.]|jgi:membrane-associated phospholipid phosphatase